VRSHAPGNASGETFGCKRFGDAVEELVAELGAVFLCADLQLMPEVREDHAAYIASWITVLKNEKRAIFSAAAQTLCSNSAISFFVASS
jgi:antirestriction protein ArdC